MANCDLLIREGVECPYPEICDCELCIYGQDDFAEPVLSSES